MTEIYYIDTADITPQRYRSLCDTLSPYRVRRASEYVFEKDRSLSVGVGYLLDIALKKRGMSERQAQYRFNEFGKPYIDGVHFNLSHSGKIAVCALSDGQVGVDVEELITPEPALINRVCTPLERASAITGDALTRLWVAKESYMKYLGTGLSLPPDRLEIDFCTPLHIKNSGVTADVAFSEYDIEGYKLTVCADEVSAPPQKITFDQR